MNREMYEIFQKKWNFFIKAVKKKRKAFLFETSIGPVFVKGYDSFEKAQWVVSLSRQLLENGFLNTLEYYMTADGSPLLFVNGKYYVAMKTIFGRDAQYDSLTDIVRTTACLAEFHSVARGIDGGPTIPARSIPIIDKWEDRLVRFNRIIEKLKARNKIGLLEQKIIRFSPYVLQEADFALDIAKRSPLIEEYETSISEQHVAHRDLASHNFLIGPQTYLIDYDTSAYDSQLIDLIQMINRVLDQQAWSLGVFAEILDVYGQSVSLSESQVALIYLLLRYPDNFMREVIGLYEGDALTSQKIEAYLMMIMKNWKNRNTFFKGSGHFFYEEIHSDSTNVVS